MVLHCAECMTSHLDIAISRSLLERPVQQRVIRLNQVSEEVNITPIDVMLRELLNVQNAVAVFCKVDIKLLVQWCNV